MSENPNGSVYSPSWFEPEPELRLVNGCWIAFQKGVPQSSVVANEGERKPTTLREKKAQEEAERLAKEAAEAAAEEAAAAEAEDTESDPAQEEPTEA